MRHVRWLVRTCSAAGAAAVLLVLVAATPSWAPHVAQLQVTPSQARPGQEVTVYGPRGYGPTNPVEVRWGSPTGPVLGTFQPNTESYAQWGPGQVTIPADAKAGTVELFATQNLTPGETYIRGIPSQASIQIVTEGGAAPVVSGPSKPAPSAADQPAVGLAEEEASSSGHLVLIALGVAGAALFLGGGAAILVARRPRPAEAPAGARPVGSGR
ncbi:MAG TPA: hypothetical protein VL337_05705 [Acidimicrobiales bacterium]|jgi:hypothetical protein|nr:hypothetical protein [Acidimicrobiales bacterium]